MESEIILQSIENTTLPQVVATTGFTLLMIMGLIKSIYPKFAYTMYLQHP